MMTQESELLVEKFRLILGNHNRLASLRSVFDELGANGNGALSVTKLKLALSVTKLRLEQLSKWDGEESPHMTNAEVEKLFIIMDTDGSGDLDFDEFMEIAKTELEKGELEKEKTDRDQQKPF